MEGFLFYKDEWSLDDDGKSYYLSEKLEIPAEFNFIQYFYFDSPNPLKIE